MVVKPSKKDGKGEKDQDRISRLVRRPIENFKKAISPEAEDEKDEEVRNPHVF